VVSAADPLRGAKSDAWHLKEAMAEQRVVITLNRSDFLYLHQFWTTLCTFKLAQPHHSGILTTIQSGYWTRPEWLNAIRAKLNQPDELVGRMSAWLRTAGDDRWLWEQWKPDED